MRTLTYIDTIEAFTKRFGKEALWQGEGFYDKRSAEFSPITKRDWSKERPPMVVSDYQPYFSVATNKWVDGKRERREDLARSGCVPWEKDSKRDPKGVASKRMAKKYGLPWSEEAAHRPRPKRIDPLADVAMKP